MAGKMEKLPAGSAADPENPAPKIEFTAIDESAYSSQPSQNQNDDHSTKTGKMEPITAGSAADPENPARTIEVADESATSFSQGSQNQNNAPSRSHEISLHSKFAALRSAAVNGDWREAIRLLRDDPQLVLLRTAITELQETALHIATGERQVDFVVKLVNLMQPEDLTLRDRNGNTAFCIAAADGNIRIVNVMLEKNKNLLTIRGLHHMMPLYMAVLLGKKEMATFLYGKDTVLTSQDRTGLFFQSIKSDLYDFALRLLEDKPKLVLYRDENEDTALHVLSRKPSSIFNQEVKFSRNQESMPTPALKLLKHVLKATKQHFADIKDLTKYSSNLLFDAARLGNSQFLDELIQSYPSLVHELDEKGRTIFHIAILHRQTIVFNLIHKTGFHKEIIVAYVDDEGNSMLHLAAKYSDQSPETALSSAALEMQKKLIIFQEVEKLIQPSLRGAKNADGLTPRELFASDHTSLRQSGALWMNNTANSCSLVATLIATVVFAAAFTVPGGTDDKTATPVLLKKTLFRVFAISDAIALSSSSFSILMFLSILTSGYTQSQFHRSLPLKLLIGLLALFISILFMMITFSSTYFLLHHDQSLCIPMLIVVFVSVPTSLFVLLQYPLLRDMFDLIRRSGFGFLSKPGFLSK